MPETKLFKVTYTYARRETLTFDAESRAQASEMALFIPYHEPHLRKAPPDGFHVESIEPIKSR